MRSNPGILELDAGTVKQKLHWNDIDDLELPKVERKVELNDGTLYLIDDKIFSKEEADNIDPEDIEEIYVSKDGSATKMLDSINQANNSNYNALVKIVLKKDS